MYAIFFVSALTILLSCTSKQVRMENRMKQFISSYEEKIIPLYRGLTIASWNANISGTDKDWTLSEQASLKYAKVHSDTAAFAELKAIKESGEVKDTLLARQLTLLYNFFLEGRSNFSDSER